MLQDRLLETSIATLLTVNPCSLPSIISANLGNELLRNICVSTIATLSVGSSIFCDHSTKTCEDNYKSNFRVQYPTLLFCVKYNQMRSTFQQEHATNRWMNSQCQIQEVLYGSNFEDENYMGYELRRVHPFHFTSLHFTPLYIAKIVRSKYLCS